MNSKSTQVFEILERAKAIAVEYYQVTGKPLGVTAEIGEYIAATTLGLTLAAARTAGFDATDKLDRRIQIKTRSLPTPSRPKGRVGSIKIDQPWDCVQLVLLAQDFELFAIYEADRHSIEQALALPGSRARNERGSLTIRKFKSIGRKVWPVETELPQ